MRAKLLCPLQGLALLPGLDFFRIAGEQDVGHLPAVEFGRAGVDGRGQQAVLEGVGEGGGFIAQRARKQPDHGVHDDGGRNLAAAEHVVAHRDFARHQVLADAVVDSLVVAAENDQIALAGKRVGDALIEDFAVGGGVDHLVVVAFGFQLLDEVVDGFDHHHHAGVAAVAVVVRLPVESLAIIADVVDVNLHQPLVYCAFDNRVAQRALEQFRNYTKDINSHAAKIGIISILMVYLQFRH